MGVQITFKMTEILCAFRFEEALSKFLNIEVTFVFLEQKTARIEGVDSEIFLYDLVLVLLGI